MRRGIGALVVLVAVGLAACAEEETSSPEGAGGGGGAAGAIEDFPLTIPTPPEGALVFAFPEDEVAAGVELQNCYFLPPLEQDVYLSGLKSYQGATGHHLVLFRALTQEPAGTLRDCTELNDMVTLVPVIASTNFGFEEFPAGMAVRVPAGTQLVLQQHIVNVTDHAVKLRDVAHGTTLPEAQVQTRAAFYGLGNVTFSIPPGGAPYESTITCTVPRDMNVLMMGPHMHEWGKSIVAEAGPEGALAEVMRFDPWETWMRDEPSTVQFGVEGAMPLHQGEKIRVTCAWSNDTEAALRFPHEMCAAYGYYFPAPLEDETWTCSGD